MIDGNAMEPKVGIRDLPDGRLTISYALGKAGEKTIVFGDTAIEVTVRHPGRFRELLPLLKGPEDVLELPAGKAVLRRGNVAMTVQFDGADHATFLDTKSVCGKRSVITLHMEARDQLSYRIAFSDISGK